MKYFLTALCIIAIVSCKTTPKESISYVSAGNDLASIRLDLAKTGDAFLDVYFVPSPPDVEMIEDTITHDMIPVEDTIAAPAGYIDSLLLKGTWDMEDDKLVVSFDKNSMRKEYDLKNLFGNAGELKNDVTVLDGQTISFSSKDSVVWILGVRCDKLRPITFQF
jgi:hypothetical protein